LTFDCYGTLIDWESGMLAAAGVADGEAFLEAYGRREAELEGGDYLPYREILARSYLGAMADLGIEATEADAKAFAEAIRDWPAFDDTPAALAKLAERFRLGVITNCDDDLFAASAEKLGADLDWVITAQQAGAYKPSHRPFEVAFERLALPRERILHVAQSLFHDHVPARELELMSVWIDRRGGKEGSGATPEADAQPDAVFGDMESFAAAATR
jgi:2-haloacid dehalogenase